MHLLHMTAFRYGTAYFTGMIFGYIMEKGHIKRIYNSPWTTKIFALVTTYFISSIIIGCMRHTSLFGGLPVFTAIEHALSGIVPMLMTCYWIIYTFENTNKFNRFWNRFLRSPYWRPIRVSQHTSYSSPTRYS